MTGLSFLTVVYQEERKAAYSLTVAQGHTHVDFFLVVKDLPQLDDVRVVQSLKDVHLFLVSRQRRFIREIGNGRET